MDELTRAPERLLIDCFRALDAGATNDDCFARYPMQADSLRGVLDMRAQLLTLKTAAPSPATFASGREALLARVVRPLASSHPGSMETEGRTARGLMWRPATRAAFAGALLFAMASCAIGVSATPAADKLDQVLPNIPAIPHQRPVYPFPSFNNASPGILPTAAPTEPVHAAPQPSGEPQSDPSVQPSSSPDSSTPSDDQPIKTKPSSPGDGWLPPTNAHETDPPAVTTPDPTGQPDASNSSDHHNGHDDKGAADSSNDSTNGSSDSNNPPADARPHNRDGTDSSAQQGETSADAVPSS